MMPPAKKPRTNTNRTTSSNTPGKKDQLVNEIEKIE